MVISCVCALERVLKEIDVGSLLDAREMGDRADLVGSWHLQKSRNS